MTVAAFIAVVVIVYLLESRDIEAIVWLHDLSETPAVKWGAIILLGLGMLGYLMGFLHGGRLCAVRKSDESADEQTVC